MPPLRQYVVTGIFETGFYEFDAALVYVPLAAAQRDLQWGDLATGIQARLVNAFEANRVSAELREVLRPAHPDMFPTSWMYAQGNLYAWIWLQKWASFVVLSLIVVVAGFNVISILTLAVNERRREIGILKAMGAAPKSIAQIFSREGLLVGVAGILFGNVLGGGLCGIQKLYAPIFTFRRHLFHQCPARDYERTGFHPHLGTGIVALPRIHPLARKTRRRAGSR